MKRIIKNSGDVLTFVMINFNVNTIVALLYMFLMLPLTLISIFYQDTKIEASKKYENIEDIVVMVSLIIWVCSLVAFIVIKFMELMLWLTV